MGSLRFRRSVKLGPGVRMSVSKTGLGLSLGTRGGRYSVHTSGRTTRSVGIPGTGISHVSTSTGGKRAASRTSVAAPQSARNVYPSPDSSAESRQALHEGIHAYMEGDHERALAALEKCLATEPTATSAHLIAAICLSTLDRPEADQIRHLEVVVTSGSAMPDKLQSKELPP